MTDEDWTERDVEVNLIGSIWARVEMKPGMHTSSIYNIMSDETVEVIRTYHKLTRYQERDEQTIDVLYAEVLTDEGKTEIWEWASFEVIHYRLPGGN